MINLTMWGFEPGGGFGASATASAEAEAAGEGGGGVPEDLTFGARLAESLSGVPDESAEAEEWTSAVPAAFVLTPQWPEPVTGEREEPANHGAKLTSKADGEVPMEGAGDAVIDDTWVLPVVGTFTPPMELTDAPPPAESGLANGAAEADAGFEKPVPGSRELRLERRIAEGSPLPLAARDESTKGERGPVSNDGALQPVPAVEKANGNDPVSSDTARLESATGENEHRVEKRAEAASEREGERHVSTRVDRQPGLRGQAAVEAPVTRAHTDGAASHAALPGNVVNPPGTLVPDADATAKRETARVDRLNAAPEARDAGPTPALRREHAPSAGEQDREERATSASPEPRVHSADAPSPTDLAKMAAAEHLAPPVASQEPARATVEGPRLLTLSAPLQQLQAIGADVEMPAPPETQGPLPRETAESIIQSVRMQYQRGGGDAVVHVKPEHLGPVSVSLRVENGSVSAVVNAENPAVAEWLKANEHLLRDGLASSGLHLERFAIKRDGHPHDDGRKGWQPPEGRERRRRALKPDSTFEITV